MEIKLNDTTVQVNDGTTILTCLNENNVKNSSGIAVAKNNQVIPKAEWEHTVLNNNDQLTIITATAGG